MNPVDHNDPDWTDAEAYDDRDDDGVNMLENDGIERANELVNQL